MTFQESLSKAIELQRVRLGVSVAEFAERLGITRQYYYELRQNKTLWKIDDLNKIAEALELESVWTLLDMAKHESGLVQNLAA